MAIRLSPPLAYAQEAHHGSTLLDRVGNTPLLRLGRVTRGLAPLSPFPGLWAVPSRRPENPNNKR